MINAGGISKAFLIITIVFVLTIGVIISMAHYSANTIITDLTTEMSYSANQNLVNYLTSLKEKAVQWSEVFANRDSVKSALKNGDYKSLGRILEDSATNVDHASVCAPNGAVLASTSYAEFSEDISGQRDVAAVLRTGKPSDSISFMTDGVLALSASVPIFDGDLVIGVVNSYYDLSRVEHMDIFKSRAGAEVAIFVGGESIVTTIHDLSGNSVMSLKPDDAAINAIFSQNHAHFAEVRNIYGRSYGIHYSPIITDGEIVAMLLSGVDIHSAIATSERLNRLIIVSGALGIILAAVLMLFTARYNRRLQEMIAKTSSFDNLDKLLRSLDTGIVIVDVKTDRIVFINEVLKADYGITGDIVGRKCCEFLFRDSVLGCEFCPMKRPEFILSENPVTFERHCPANGKYYRIICKLIDWPNGSKVLFEQRIDISELNESQENLRTALAEAEVANTAKTQFLATMSHEIRTPMNGIIGFAELALDELDFEINPKVIDYLKKIKNSSSWLLHIINDLLDISKIESGKLELEKAYFSLSEVIMRVQSVILPTAKDKGIDLIINTDPLIGKKILGDSVRLYQALLNLLSNAVKFTDSGAVEFTSSKSDADDNKTAVLFKVRDSGIGMTEQQVSRIFEPFVQADSSTTRIYGGTGLGLSITKSLVELMGGKLIVETAPGDGSAFSFEIVFETIDSHDETSEQTGHVLKKPQFDGLVLVCDDNSLNRQVICEHLAKVGIRTITAENGQLGLEKVMERVDKNEEPFDLIFMDIFMPVMDGLEATAKIAKLDVGTPIVALTANIIPSEVEKFKNRGMQDCLGKPFTTQDLWRILLKYLDPVSVTAVDKKRQDSDEEELLNLLKLNFVKSNQHTYANMENAVNAGDIELAERIAHTLKGNAGQIGEQPLQEAAAAAEEKLSQMRNAISGGEARSNKTSQTVTSMSDSLMEVVKGELASVLKKLAPMLEEDIQNVRSEIPNAEETRELLKRLELMLEIHNPECMNLVDEIRLIPGAEELARQIEDFEFRKAKNTLKKLTGGLQDNG